MRLIVPIENTTDLPRNEVVRMEAEEYLKLLNSMIRSGEIEKPSLPVAMHLSIRTIKSNEVLVTEDYISNIVDMSFTESRLRVEETERELGYNFFIRKIKELLDFYFGENVSQAMVTSTLQPIGVSVTEHKMYSERLVVHFIIYIEEQYKYMFKSEYQLVHTEFMDITKAYEMCREIEPFAMIVKPNLTIVRNKK